MDACLGPADTDGFSALACRDRWLALQRLRVAANIDCVVLIVGPDAQFGRGAEVLFNWLLCGLGGREVLTVSLDPQFEECVVCIQATRSAIFCKRAVHDKIATLTSMWENVEIIVPTREEELDQDLFDERKIGTFIDMVHPCRSLGVVVRGVDIHIGDLKMTVERWPLVQAYAYDEYGHGFLTMKKSVTNLEDVLQTQLYPCWDLHAVLWAANLASQLRKAWDGALLVQDKHSAAHDESGAASLNVALAPLLDFFEYGRLTLTDEEILELRASASTAIGGDMPAPRVLAGPVESMEILGPSSAAPASSVLPPVGSLHAIWEAVDPLAGIAATRTYGSCTMLHSNGHAGPQLQTLCKAYTAAASCCCHLLQGPMASVAFSPTRDLEVRDLAASFLHSRFPDVLGTINAYCILLDTMGFPAASAQAGRGIALVFLRIAISGMQCPETGAPLGAVAYGDSVFCTAATEDRAAEVALSSALTDTLPTFASWLSVAERALSKSVKDGMDSNFGVGMSPGVFVALGHRPGMKVPVDPPATPPDPLGLGSVIDTEFRASLAIDVGLHTGAERPIASFTNGVAWTFSSGKVVFSSPRTGYVLLQVLQTPEGIPSLEAAAGLMWVPAAAAAIDAIPSFSASGWSRLVVAVTPMSVMQWRGDQETRDVDNSHVQWVSAAVSNDAVPHLTDEFLSRAALCDAYGGNMPISIFNAMIHNTIAAVATTGTCRVIWVTGLPGCGALDIAEPLARVLGAPLVDLAAVVGFVFDLVAGDNGVDAVAPLTQVLREQVRLSGCSVLVVCDVLCVPAEVLSGLANHTDFADTFQATHVISVLDPLIVYPWMSMRHPLALSRSHRGWVTVTIVQDHRSAASGISVREWNPIAARLLHELKACRAGGHVLQKPPTGSLIDGPLQELPATAALRGLALPGSVLPGGPCETTSICHPSDQLLGIFVPMNAPVDLGNVRESCASILKKAVQVTCPLAGETEERIWRGLFCIEAHLFGADAKVVWSMQPAQLQELFHGGTAFSTERFVLSTRGEMPIPQHWTAPLAKSSGFVWWWCIPKSAGRDFSSWRAAAQTVVEACRLRPPAVEPTWARADVPQDHVSQLEDQARALGLPDGCFFNGTNYVDVDGNESREHPGLSQLLDTFLAQHNSEVQARNSALQEIAGLPVFGA